MPDEYLAIAFDARADADYRNRQRPRDAGSDRQRYRRATTPRSPRKPSASRIVEQILGGHGCGPCGLQPPWLIDCGACRCGRRREYRRRSRRADALDHRTGLPDLRSIDASLLTFRNRMAFATVSCVRHLDGSKRGSVQKEEGKMVKRGRYERASSKLVVGRDRRRPPRAEDGHRRGIADQNKSSAGAASANLRAREAFTP